MGRIVSAFMALVLLSACAQLSEVPEPESFSIGQVGKDCHAVLPYGPLEFEQVRILAPGWMVANTGRVSGYTYIISVTCDKWE